MGGGWNDLQHCIIYTVCHGMGMLSACANPIIYGFLNENFKRQFTELFLQFKKWCFCESLRQAVPAAAPRAPIEEKQVQQEPLIMTTTNKKVTSRHVVAHDDKEGQRSKMPQDV